MQLESDGGDARYAFVSSSDENTDVKNTIGDLVFFSLFFFSPDAADTAFFPQEQRSATAYAAALSRFFHCHITRMR
jgi:hypothetical protein